MIFADVIHTSGAGAGYGYGKIGLFQKFRRLCADDLGAQRSFADAVKTQFAQGTADLFDADVCGWLAGGHRRWYQDGDGAGFAAVFAGGIGTKTTV